MEGIYCIYGTSYKPCYLDPHPLVCGVNNWKLLQNFYNFFGHNLKWHHEFFKPLKLVDTKGNKIFKNIKMHWISTFSLTKWIFLEYKTLLAKMLGNAYEISQAWINFDSSCDVPIVRNASIQQVFVKEGHLCMWLHWGHQTLLKLFLHTL
jgi:hypothetical protein